MNSLAYLSRQFDVLASAKTPPSTPTSERASFVGDRSKASRREASESSLQRVQTWSTKPLLLPQHPGPRPSSPPKRSFSSPADFIALASLQGLPSTSQSPSVSVEKQSGSPSQQLDYVLRRTFFVRLLVLAWNTLRAMWSSLTGRKAVGRLKEAVIESGNSISDKDSSDEDTADETYTSTIPSPPTARSPSFPADLPSNTEPPPPYDARPDPKLLSASLLPSSTVTSSIPTPSADLPVSSSRSSTPILNSARKTPFHLPKTLVLDLDETLIHSTSRPMPPGSGDSGLFGLGGSFGRSNKGAGHIVEVMLGGRSTLYHVYKRPFVDFFLRTVRVRMIATCTDPDLR